ncbi:MAG: competence/damage-inducible protein A [Thermodesulfovibrionales bacterium]|nr:competence/damage-inducible protein A [Thermodesulfovibrionales bacterium]
MIENITKTAGIIIIGNEILSGKVMDVNSYFLVTELRALGVDVLKISIIPDDVRTISQEVRFFSALFDYVFTTGGIGPTHDDLTIEGICTAFGVKMIYNERLVSCLKTRYGDSINEAALKMALVPEGADLLMTEGNNLPIVSYKNIIIFPGVPHLLRKKFHALKEKFRCSEYFIKKIFLNTDEIQIADFLNKIVSAYGNLLVGSYPAAGTEDFKVLVTLESKSLTTLEKALKELLSLMPSEYVIKIQ